MKPENTNPCERVEPLLSAHLLHELPREETEDVAAHVLVCNACQDELELLSRTVNVLARGVPSESTMGDAAPGDAALGDAARRRILEAASRGGADSRGAARRPRATGYWLCGLAAAALIAVGVVSFLQPSGARHSAVLTDSAGQRDATASFSGGGGGGVVPIELAKADGRTSDKSIPDINGAGATISPGWEWGGKNEVERRKPSAELESRDLSRDPAPSASPADGLEVAGIPTGTSLTNGRDRWAGRVKNVADNFRFTGDGRSLEEKDSGASPGGDSTSLEKRTNLSTDFSDLATVSPGSAEELAARRLVEQGPAPGTRSYSLSVGEGMMGSRGLPASGPEAARPALVATPAEAPAPAGEREIYFRGDTNSELLARDATRPAPGEAKPALADDRYGESRLYRNQVRDSGGPETPRGPFDPGSAGGAPEAKPALPL
ncbi:MAG TPA: zf-HC2 domain-containing protein, partial [Planctomycetota bacterium]|nr:zf-HC2 domain-containing protein [Planctomycetota bacterium]